jgi:CheY-like chemotaxis protein
MTSRGSTESPPPEPALDLVTKPLRLILVVDDDAAVRAFLKDSLMQHGYGVWAAPSATIAISILRERRIDLIVGDASSLEPDGEKTLRKLRRSRRGIKILAMTGASPAILSTPILVGRRSRFPLMAPCLEARLFLGAHAILPKPVSADLLVKTVKTLLGDNA